MSLWIAVTWIVSEAFAVPSADETETERWKTPALGQFQVKAGSVEMVSPSIVQR